MKAASRAAQRVEPTAVRSVACSVVCWAGLKAVLRAEQLDDLRAAKRVEWWAVSRAVWRAGWMAGHLVSRWAALKAER